MSRPNNPLPGLVSALHISTIPQGNILIIDGDYGEDVLPLVTWSPGSVHIIEYNLAKVQWLRERFYQFLAYQSLKIHYIYKPQILLDPNIASVVVINRLKHLPKPEAVQLLQTAWQALKVGGIICVAFPSYENGLLSYRLPCFGYEVDKRHRELGSYVYSCPHLHCGQYAAGIIGASFWRSDEAHNTLTSMGPCQVVGRHIQTWQDAIIVDRRPVTIRQHYHVFTAQKL